jgi:hypothetical protein
MQSFKRFTNKINEVVEPLLPGELPPIPIGPGFPELPDDYQDIICQAFKDRLDIADEAVSDAYQAFMDAIDALVNSDACQGVLDDDGEIPTHSSPSDEPYPPGPDGTYQHLLDRLMKCIKKCIGQTGEIHPQCISDCWFQHNTAACQELRNALDYWSQAYLDALTHRDRVQAQVDKFCGKGDTTTTIGTDSKKPSTGITALPKIPKGDPMSGGLHDTV